jgi:hypothetical protein
MDISEYYYRTIKHEKEETQIIGNSTLYIGVTNLERRFLTISESSLAHCSLCWRSTQPHWSLRTPRGKYFLVKPIFTQRDNFPVSYGIRRFITFLISTCKSSPFGSKLTHSPTSQYVSLKSNLILSAYHLMSLPMRPITFCVPSKMLPTFLNSHTCYISSSSASFVRSNSSGARYK